jgi:hypothetical protein
LWRWCPILHSDLIPEIGCDGELIQIDERSTLYVTVARCSIRLDLRNRVHLGARFGLGDYRVAWDAKPIEQANVGFLIGTAVCNQPGCPPPLTAGLCK